MNELCSLRRSLNTPVLSIAELPVGPGTAAIAVHVDSCDGLSRYTLAVRSERSRKVVFFSAGDENYSRSEPSLAAEAALSLAEGMGFLFEEDLTQISRETAVLIWEEFVDSADPSPPVAASASLLTKFRRPPSWVTVGPETAGAFPEGPQCVPLGPEAEFERSNTQIAPQGDR